MNKARTLAHLQPGSYEETGMQLQFQKFPTKKEATYYDVIGFLVGGWQQEGEELAVCEGIFL
ncbi:hypothetical protein EMIT043CA1_190055 [Pseudomonas brassicacearum]